MIKWFRICVNPFRIGLLGRFESSTPSHRERLVATCIEMMGLIGAGNNPMVGMTVAVAVSIQEASENGKF